MNILFISDIHFKNFHDFSSEINGFNSRLIDIENSVLQSIDIGIENNCELCCICGDVFDTHGSLKTEEAIVAFRCISSLAKIMPVIIISGNHDYSSYKNNISLVEILGYIQNVKIIKKSTYFSFEGINIICIPYMHDVKEFKDEYRMLSKNSNKDSITLLHCGIDDFKKKALPDTKISIDFLSENNKGYIFTGHYHSFKTLGRVTQIGAICQHNLNDEGDKRGCVVFKDGEIEFNEIISPKFLTINTSENSVSDLDELKSNNYVRVISNNRDHAGNVKKILTDKNIKCKIIIENDKNYSIPENKNIKADTDREMIIEYINMEDKYKTNKDEIVNLYCEL